MTKAEIEHLAKQRYGYPCQVTQFTTKMDGIGTPWYMLELLLAAGGRKIVGCRRSIEELPALIQRGSAQECLADAKVRPVASRDCHDLPSDPSGVER